MQTKNVIDNAPREVVLAQGWRVDTSGLPSRNQCRLSLFCSVASWQTYTDWSEITLACRLVVSASLSSGFWTSEFHSSSAPPATVFNTIAPSKILLISLIAGIDPKSSLVPSFAHGCRSLNLPRGGRFGNRRVKQIYIVALQDTDSVSK